MNRADEPLFSDYPSKVLAPTPDKLSIEDAQSKGKDGKNEHQITVQAPTRNNNPAFKSPINVSPSWKVYQGDSRVITAQLQPNSINCVVTSPPYYWQRDYGVDGQIGKEDTIQGFVDNIVEVFRGIKSALKKDGVVFLNLGDTYYSAKGRPHGKDSKHVARNAARQELRAVDGPGLGLPRKSLIGIPWRTALALAQDGWTLRSDIIWMRKTAMPEPTAIDRPWRQHEHVFMFSLSPKYYFNREALGAEEDIWLIEPERNNAARGLHYAPFPSTLVKRCLDVGCPTDGIVLDPFAGGGTTMLVAQKMGLSSVGIELNPDFCSFIAGKMSAETIL